MSGEELSNLSSRNWLRENEREILKDIGEEIASARNKEGWSQRELADMVGTTQTSIRRMEKGQTNASIVILMRTFRALRLNPDVHLEQARTREELIDAAYEENKEYIERSTAAMSLRKLDTATKRTLMEMLDIWEE